MEMRGRIHWLAVFFLLFAAGCSAPTGPAGDGGTGLEPPSFLSPVAHAVAVGIESVGIGIILLGAIAATIVFVREWVQEDGFSATYRRYRERLGQAILLGLEFLVAADIIGTVAVDPTFRNVGILGAIVAIRTFLSFALEVEIQGRWPWAYRQGDERRLPEVKREDSP
jgi:uncharacterized membrane protein